MKRLSSRVDYTEWVLRIAVSGTFLGHGVLALQGKPEWIPYLTLAGFSSSAAASLLPLIGAWDVVVAILALAMPLRIVLIWAVFWGFATALIRPLSGASIWDFVERTANFAAPLALLMMHGIPRKISDLFSVH